MSSLSFSRVGGECPFLKGGKPSRCPLETHRTTGEVTMVSSHQWIRADVPGLRSLRRSGQVSGMERVGAIVVCRDLTVEREAQPRCSTRVASFGEFAESDCGV